MLHHVLTPEQAAFCQRNKRARNKRACPVNSPRLALLYAEVGDQNKAEIYIQKAKLSLEILYGLARCDLDYEYSPGVQLENLYDQAEIGILRGRELVKLPIAEEIFFRMCQENMVDFYPHNYDLNRLLDDPLVSLYRKARTIVQELKN